MCVAAKITSTSSQSHQIRNADNTRSNKICMGTVSKRYKWETNKIDPNESETMQKEIISMVLQVRI